MTIAHNNQFPSGNQFFKKILIVVCVLWLLATLFGCSSQYAAERLYWQAGQKASQITKDKAQDKLTSDDYQRIIAAYGKVVEKYPLELSAAQSEFIIARLHVLQKEYSQAHKELIKVTQNFARNPAIASQAQFMIGNLYTLQGDWDKAVSEYEKVTDLYPLSKPGLSTPIYIAQHYQQMKNLPLAEKAYDKAIRDYEKIIEEYSGTSIVPAIMEYLALAYLNQGEWEEAVKVWEKISNEYSQSPQAERSLLSSGEIYTRQIKDLEKAIKTYEDFAKQYPESKVIKQVKFQIGKLYLVKGDTAKAKELLFSVIKQYPKELDLCANSRFLLAACYEKEGESTQAVGEYQKIRTDYPKSKLALAVPFFIARYYQDIDSEGEEAGTAFAEAISEYEGIIKTGTDVPLVMEAGRLASLCYIQQKRWNEAINSLYSLTLKYPEAQESEVFLFNIANIYQNELKAPDKAINIYKEFIEKHPASRLTEVARLQLSTLEKTISTEQGAGSSSEEGSSLTPEQ